MPQCYLARSKSGTGLMGLYFALSRHIVTSFSAAGGQTQDAWPIKRGQTFIKIKLFSLEKKTLAV